MIFEDGEATAGSVIIKNGRRYAGRQVRPPSAEIDQPGFQMILLKSVDAWSTTARKAALPSDQVARARLPVEARSVNQALPVFLNPSD